MGLELQKIVNPWNTQYMIKLKGTHGQLIVDSIVKECSNITAM